MWRICGAALLLAVVACSLPKRHQLWIVGSSTLYPFVASAAEQFGRAEGNLTPIVEANGTGGGIKLFCEGVGLRSPDIANASRPMKDTEKALCAKNGVTEIAEFQVGYDGIVLANLKTSLRYHLSREQLFQALAKELPNKDGKLIANPYRKWSEIDAALPDVAIEVYGPPPTSGTRDAFVELVMEHSCKGAAAFIAAYPNEDIRKKQCHLLREDGHFIDAGENDNIIVQKLKHSTTALGIFGYSFLEQNQDVLQGSLIENTEPRFDNISTGKYPISRSLYMYVKKAHLKKIAGLKAFMQEMTSENAIGAEGYLVIKGLIPLPASLQEQNKEKADNGL
jgi:phosphate transport system substrate-binding protein